jgi:hypothetical protein
MLLPTAIPWLLSNLTKGFLRSGGLTTCLRSNRSFNGGPPPHSFGASQSLLEGVTRCQQTKTQTQTHCPIGQSWLWRREAVQRVTVSPAMPVLARCVPLPSKVSGKQATA